MLNSTGGYHSGSETNDHLPVTGLVRETWERGIDSMVIVPRGL